MMSFPRRLAPAFIGGVAFVMYRATAGAEELGPLPRRTSTSAPEQLRAVVVGATGATGRQLVRRLCDDGKWTSVTVVARRPPADGELYDGRHAPAKLLVQVVSNLEAPEDEARILEGWAGAHVLFNTLGTTRGAAGGAAGFKHVEVNLTARAAELGRKAGIACASVVSAQGANADMYVDPWERVHPLLYVQTLGRKEAAMCGAAFEQLSIFRPGMLNRMTGDRAWENVANWLGLGLRVDHLATAMALDGAAMVAATRANDRTSAGAPIVYDGNSRITQCSSEANWKAGSAK